MFFLVSEKFENFRRAIEVEKGMSVGDFLKGAREQLAKEFREMRAVSVDNLMFVKVEFMIHV